MRLVKGLSHSPLNLAESGVHVRGEPSVRRGELLGVLLDPRHRDDHHVLQDLQGGRAPEGGAQPRLQQYRPQQCSLASRIHHQAQFQGVPPVVAASERCQRLRQAHVLQNRRGAERGER